MKSTNLTQFSRKPITPRRIKTLAAKALKDGFEIKPAKGKIFLKDAEQGSLFRTSLLKGILIGISGCSAKVIITERDGEVEDDRFYLGNKLLALETEVEIL